MTILDPKPRLFRGTGSEAMKFYMHPEVAARLLVQSRAYRAFRLLGWDRSNAQEMARVYVELMA